MTLRVEPKMNKPDNTKSRTASPAGRPAAFGNFDCKPGPELDHEVLELWEHTEAFAHLRERNRGGETFSFLDGPMTANNPMAAHHAWGRTLKDLFQRYQAMQGRDQRYQNGFDCQGLWLEVETEKELKLKGKQDVQAFGLAEFVARCRERAARFSSVQSEQSKRLGMWMDWGRDYYTFSDSNQEYNWRFLKACHEQGMLYQAKRVMAWCPRCGTSLSDHEQAGSYRDLVHPSLCVAFPLLSAQEANEGLQGLHDGSENDQLVAWTTTPWSLLANQALAVLPDADYVRLQVSGAKDVYVVAEARLSELPFTGTVLSRLKGADLVGQSYKLPFAEGAGRVVAWDEVSLTEGTGVVHVAPGCGAEDFELGQCEHLTVVSPLREDGCVAEGFPFAGLSSSAASKAVVDDLSHSGLVVHYTQARHRYPVCWRCREPLVSRLVSEWFLKVDTVREQLCEEARKVTWQPEYEGRRMDDWLCNMQDWCVSRKRYFGLPLPFYPCECGHLTVVGSKQELREHAVDSLLVDELPELHRPFVDDVKVRCVCGREVSRVPEVGDVWLDAGVVPLSTLGFENPVLVPRGLGDGAARGLTEADLPSHADFEKWFPADFVCEMREQTRLWFYATLFVSVVLTGRAPYKRVVAYERVNDEEGNKMSKTGKNVSVDDVFERLGADPLRLLYCAQPLTQPLALGEKKLREAAGRLGLYWNTASFLATYAEEFRPQLTALDTPPKASHPLDRWLVARTQQVTEEVTKALDDFSASRAMRCLDAFAEELSTWYLRSSRERLKDSHEAKQVFWYALVRFATLLAPSAPFVAEGLYQRLVKGPCSDAPESVFLLPWPAVFPYDESVLEDARLVMAAVEAGRAARAQSGHRLRQPLAEAKLGLPQETLTRYRDVMLAELNVRTLSVAEGKEPPSDWAADRRGGVAAWVDGRLTPELTREGEDNDARSAVQQARKKAGLKVGEPALLVVGEGHPLSPALARLDAADLVKLSVTGLQREDGEGLKVQPTG